MPSLIKLKQGLFSNLPSLQTGEPGFCTDTFHLYIGSGSGNKKIGADADTLNSHDSDYLLDRTNHTGTQAASTISDFAEAAQDAVGGILDSSADPDDGDIQFTYTDNDEDPGTIVANIKDGAIDYSMIAATSLIDDMADASSTTLAPTSVIKSYIDMMAEGLSVKGSVRAATTEALAATYDTGVLTATGNGVLELDGITDLANGQKVLVKDQTGANEKYNGVYVITNVGAVDAPFVLTRAANFDGTPAGEVGGGAYVFVEEGDVQKDSGWVVVSDSPITFDTDPITFNQFSGAGQIIAGNGIDKSVNTISVLYDDSTIGIDLDGDLYVKADGITSTEIADGAVEAAKLNSDVAGSGIVLNGTSNAIDINVGNGIEVEGVGGTLTVKLDGASLAVDGDGLSVSAVDADVVTVSNLDTADFGAGIIVTEIVNDSDTTIPTEAAVKDYTDALENKLGSTETGKGGTVIGIYDPLDKIVATNVTAALIELATSISNIAPGSTEVTNSHSRILGTGFADVGVITVSGSADGNEFATSATTVGSVAAGDVIEVDGYQYTVSAVNASTITIYDTIVATVADIQLKKASAETFANATFTDGQFATLSERLIDIESKLDILKGRVDVIDGGTFV